MPHPPVNVNYIDNSQGPAGRYFQLRDGSSSDIGKNFRFGLGIVYICKKNYQSGIFGY